MLHLGRDVRGEDHDRELHRSREPIPELADQPPPFDRHVHDEEDQIRGARVDGTKELVRIREPADVRVAGVAERAFQRFNVGVAVVDDQDLRVRTTRSKLLSAGYLDGPHLRPRRQTVLEGSAVVYSLLGPEPRFHVVHKPTHHAEGPTRIAVVSEPSWFKP